MAYIYYITDGSGCYVGQAKGGTDKYERIQYHIKSAWSHIYKTSGDNSELKRMISSNELKDLQFFIFTSDTNYGISIDVYNSFLNIFSPDGKAYTWQELTPDKQLDLAEILHIAYASQFYRIFNVSVGGQNYQWFLTSSSTKAFDRNWNPRAFLGYLDNYKTIQNNFKEANFANWEYDLGPGIKNIIETHWSKHNFTNKKKVFNWKELENVLNKKEYREQLEISINKSFQKYLRQVKKNIPELLKDTNLIDLSFSLDKEGIKKELLKQLAQQISKAFDKKEATLDISSLANLSIDAKAVLLSTIDYENISWNNIAFQPLRQMHVNLIPTDISPWLKQWTVNMFIHVCDNFGLLDESFYQDRVNKHAKEIRKMTTEEGNFYSLERIYKKERDLNYVIHDFFLKHLPNVGYVSDYTEWEIFYNEQMNLYMQNKKQNFTYFSYNNKFYAYHITGPTLITDDEGENGYVATRVTEEGAFDRPSDMQQITIY